MAIYELDATVTLSLTAGSGATVTVQVVKPDGTTATPTPTFAGSTWTASLTGDQYGRYLYAWTVDGTISTQDTFLVGGPWYAAFARLKKAVNRKPGDETPDDMLADALEAASRSVDTYCDNRPPGAFLLADSASTRIFRRDRWTICTDAGFRLPVDDIGSLTDLVVETSTDGTTWTATTDFETWPDNALAYGLSITGLVSTSDWPDRVRVTARWGWPSVPPSVKQATLLQASRLYRRKDSPEGVAGSSEWGLVRVPNLDPDVKALLQWLHTDAMVG